LTRPLPDSFVDLPAAIATARQSGMFGQLRAARLSAGTSGSRSGHATWTLRPIESNQFQLYCIDAVTGKLIPAPIPARRHGLIGKVEGLFH
jgi:hypothetical protein